MDRDLPFTFIIATPARHMINYTTVGVSISRRPAIKTAHTPSREALRHANPLENPVFGHFFDAPCTCQAPMGPLWEPAYPFVAKVVMSRSSELAFCSIRGYIVIRIGLASKEIKTGFGERRASWVLATLWACSWESWF